jgi:hypothetical protein
VVSLALLKGYDDDDGDDGEIVEMRMDDETG